MKRLNINSLSKSYNKIEVLRNINLLYTSGTINGVIGSNGSGKSTLLNCIGGYIKYQGTIEREGITSIGLLSANPYMFPRITGSEFIQFAMSAKKQKLDVSRLNSLNEIFELPLNRFAEDYSTGMLKKLHLIALLLQNNDLLLLDEPFNGLDTMSSEYLALLLLEMKKQDAIIMISSHDNNMIAKITDTVTIIEDSTAYIQSISTLDSAKEKEAKAKRMIVGIFDK